MGTQASCLPFPLANPSALPLRELSSLPPPSSSSVILSLSGTTFQAVANAIQQNNVCAPNLKHLSLACQVATPAAVCAICFQLILKFNYFEVYLHTVVPVSPVCCTCWSMAFFSHSL